MVWKPTLVRRLLMIPILFGVAFCTSASDTTAVRWPSRDMISDGDGAWYGMGTGYNGSGTWKSRFWINFEGATVTNSESFIVRDAGRSSLSIPAFNPGDLGARFNSSNRAQMIQEITDWVRADFIDLQIEITLTRPTSGEYHTIHVGGANFTSKARVVGISPLDIANFRPNDRLFAFPVEFQSSDRDANPKLLANVISHEMGHAMGARHIQNESAILNPYVLLGTDQLNAEGQLVGTDGRENSYLLLTRTLGLKTVAAKASLESPTLNTLSIYSEGNMAMLSVFHTENTGDLSEFKFVWYIGSQILEGPSIAAYFANPAGQPEAVRVVVINPKTGESFSKDFIVGGR